MRNDFPGTITAFVLAVCMTAMGCSEGGAGASKRATVYKVKGKVTYLGNPLIDASVSFSPQGSQPAAVGRTNDNGEFTLTTYRAGDGAAEGEYKVMITLTDSAPEASAEAAHGTEPGRDYSVSHAGKKGKSSGNILPAIYSDPTKTPLSEKVAASGENNFTFDLK